jgi:hypothetical protein
LVLAGAAIAIAVDLHQRSRQRLRLPSCQSMQPNTPISDRVLLWRWLAAAFTYPDPDTWRWVTNNQSPAEATSSPPTGAADRRGDAAPTEAYLRIFGHTVKGDCPPHELEYGELKAERLLHPAALGEPAVSPANVRSRRGRRH